MRAHLGPDGGEYCFVNYPKIDGLHQCHQCMEFRELRRKARQCVKCWGRDCVEKYQCLPCAGCIDQYQLDVAPVRTSPRESAASNSSQAVVSLHGVIDELKEQVKTLHEVIPYLTEQIGSLATEFESLRSQLAKIEEHEQRKSQKQKEDEWHVS